MLIIFVKVFYLIIFSLIFEKNFLESIEIPVTNNPSFSSSTHKDSITNVYWANKANDEDTTLGWNGRSYECSYTTAAPEKNWWAIDIINVYEISKVCVINRKDHLSSCKFKFFLL